MDESFEAVTAQAVGVLRQAGTRFAYLHGSRATVSTAPAPSARDERGGQDALPTAGSADDHGVPASANRSVTGEGARCGSSGDSLAGQIQDERLLRVLARLICDPGHCQQVPLIVLFW